MSDKTGQHILAWLTLHLLPGLGAVGGQALVEHFGSPEAVLTADRSALGRVEGIRSTTIAALAGPARARAAAAADLELERTGRMGIFIIAWDDPRYPELLKDIYGPPLLLYVKGDPAALADGPALALVGSRACTDYGRRIAYRLAHDLGRRFVIISGLALGIDAQAHRGALAGGGRTVAVLGCGLDLVYPWGNRDLFDKIPSQGALVSEYPLGTKPDGFRFPARNRIISGLALGVVVVEAARNSGSLITAQHALEQGREVFAIPGRVDSCKSTGSHGLLQQGAKLVQGVADIINELPGEMLSDNPVEPALPRLAVEINDQERRLLSCLDVYPRTIDEIAVAASLPGAKVSELLLLLELKGAVRSLPGACYQLAVSLE
ncbi:MAG: DNA-processing protein DprA [Desulfobacterales bacterium]|nr:DNA-processing protein DprA [Desulfobacterales bacterium]